MLKPPRDLNCTPRKTQLRYTLGRAPNEPCAAVPCLQVKHQPNHEVAKPRMLANLLEWWLAITPQGEETAPSSDTTMHKGAETCL